MNDDLERRLESWGEQPATPPDAAFAERLERDLRSQAYFAPAAEPQPTPWFRRTFRPALLLGAGMAVLIGVLFALNDDNAPREVVMSQALGTEVTLPGEPSEPGSAGDTLPDGTQISIEANGSAVVDGVVLGGGTEAVIVDGHIEVLITAPTATPEPEPTTSVVAPPPTTRPTTRPTSIPTARPTSRPTAAPTVVPSARPTAVPTPEPRPTGTPEPRPTTTPTPTSTAPPASTATPAPVPVDPGPVAVRLEITPVSARRALLVWQAAHQDRILGWEVIAITGDGPRSIALLRDPQVRELRIERPDNLTTRYRVRARGADGVILGVSNAVRYPAGD